MASLNIFADGFRDHQESLEDKVMNGNFAGLKDHLTSLWDLLFIFNINMPG